MVKGAKQVRILFQIQSRAKKKKGAAMSVWWLPDHSHWIMTYTFKLHSINIMELEVKVTYCASELPAVPDFSCPLSCLLWGSESTLRVRTQHTFPGLTLRGCLYFNEEMLSFGTRTKRLEIKSCSFVPSLSCGLETKETFYFMSAYEAFGVQLCLSRHQAMTVKVLKCAQKCIN